MSNDSLWERIIYKKENRGKFERDGKVYVKWVKRKRFKIPHMQTILIAAILLALALIYFFVSNMIIVGNTPPK